MIILPRQKFGQREDLAVQPLGVLVVRTQVEHLVPKDGQTARLQADDRVSGFDGGLQVVQDVAQEFVGLIKESVVVERTAATEWRARNDHAESGVFEYFRRSRRHFRMKVIVESVGPENDLRFAVITVPRRWNQCLKVMGANSGTVCVVARCRR